jgi:hypothetical protein
VTPQGTATIAIRFAPASVGSKSATLQLVSNSATNPTSVTLTGRRDSLGIALSRAVVTFNGQLSPASYPIDSTIVIHNTGSLAIGISSAAITGNDRARFEIPTGQFPLSIQPGDSAIIHIRVLGPTAGAAASALVEFVLDNVCDSNRRNVRLVESGSLPALLASSAIFRPLHCADETARDTSITLTNLGGADLIISALEFVPSTPFSSSITLPISIPAGGSINLPLRFAPGAAGNFTAQLHVRSNAASGDSIISLNALRDVVAFAISRPALQFGLVPLQSVTHKFDTITNTGSTAIELALALASGSAGNFSVGGALLLTLEPGESVPVDMLFTAPASGNFADTLVVTEPGCGLSARVALSAEEFEPIHTTFVFPVDSARRDAVVEIPIRLIINDLDRFKANAPHSFSLQFSFCGALLMPVDAIGATMTRNDYDDHTTLQRVTLTGSYDASTYTAPNNSGNGSNGIVLALLRCRVPASDSVRTVLRFEDVHWDEPELLADTVNGLFNAYGDCGAQVRLVSQVHLKRLLPQPAVGASRHITAELELESEQQVRAIVIDGTGRRVREGMTKRLSAGSATLDIAIDGLASGMYWIVVESPFGSDTAPIVIAR